MGALQASTELTIESFVQESIQEVLERELIPVIQGNVISMQLLLPAALTTLNRYRFGKSKHARNAVE